MLDRSISAELMQRLWASLPSQATLPLGGAEFYGAEPHGPVPSNTRRQFERINIRTKAVLRCGQEQEAEVTDSSSAVHHAGYLRDASRLGLGLYSPVQLLPLEHFTLWLPDEEPLGVITRRCLRQQEGCYEVGTVFANGPLTPPEFRALFASQLASV